MTIQAAPEATRQDSDHGDDLDHWYCCDEMRALCGADISSSPEVEDMPNLCIVCDDLAERDCERCGE